MAERDLHLGKAFLVDEQLQRDDGLAGVLGRFLQLAYLAPLQQQFAVPFGFMVCITAEAVLGDVHLLDVHLAVFYRTIGIDERSLAFTDRLDFGTE